MRRRCGRSRPARAAPGRALPPVRGRPQNKRLEKEKEAGSKGGKNKAVARLEKARAFALPVLLETSYEPMRRAAIDRCGCAAGPPGRGTSSQAEASSEERRD